MNAIKNHLRKTDLFAELFTYREKRVAKINEIKLEIKELEKGIVILEKMSLTTSILSLKDDINKKERIIKNLEDVIDNINLHVIPHERRTRKLLGMNQWEFVGECRQILGKGYESYQPEEYQKILEIYEKKANKIYEKYPFISFNNIPINFYNIIKIKNYKNKCEAKIYLYVERIILDKLDAETESEKEFNSALKKIGLDAIVFS